MNSLFPIFLKLEEKRAVVIGGGRVAYRKVEQLLDSKASVVVVAKRFSQDFAPFQERAGLELIEAAYESSFLEGAFIVFVCTDDSEVNREVFSYCHEHNILVNAADSPPNCNFYLPSVVKRGDLKIAVSTNNRSCAYTKRIRLELEEIFDRSYADVLIYLGRIRDYLKANEPDIEVRGAILRRMAFAPNLKEIVEGLGTAGLASFDIEKELVRWL